MLLRDFPPNGTLIPYTSEQLASLFIMLPALAIAVLVDLIVLIALIWQRDIPIDTQFIISLTFGDFLFSLMEIMIGIGSGTSLTALVSDALTLFNLLRLYSCIWRLLDRQNRYYIFIDL